MSGAKVQFYFEVGEILGFFTIAGGDSKGNAYLCGTGCKVKGRSA